MLDIILTTVAKNLPEVIITGIRGLIGKFARVHQSEFSGLWADEVLDPYGALERKDIFVMEHNEHDDTSKGEITRIMSSPSNPPGQKWLCAGIMNKRQIILCYWGKNINTTSNGAIVTKRVEDSGEPAYAGHYMREDKGNIGKFNIKLKKIKLEKTSSHGVMYAVLDWDNTLRDGHALYSLVDHLLKLADHPLKKDFFDTTTVENLKSLKKDYAFSEFARLLEGKKKSELFEYVKDFKNIDAENMYGFTTKVFDTLIALNIKPIIISGAPKIVVDAYREQFNLFAIYASDFKTNEKGKFTGDVGYDIDAVIGNLKKALKTSPCITFSYSLSNKTFFKESKLNFTHSQDEFPGIRNIHLIDKNTPGEKIADIIKEKFKHKGK